MPQPVPGGRSLPFWPVIFATRRDKATRYMEDATLINGLLAKRNELVKLNAELRERMALWRTK